MEGSEAPRALDHEEALWRIVTRIREEADAAWSRVAAREPITPRADFERWEKLSHFASAVTSLLDGDDDADGGGPDAPTGELP